MTDANVMCVTLAAGCLERLAIGLRVAFRPFREPTVAPLLARTKEKKASVLDALGKALDAVFASVGLLWSGNTGKGADRECRSARSAT